MRTWAESKQIPGQFTGSTGVRVLTPAELASGYQAWARKVKLLLCVLSYSFHEKPVPKNLIPESPDAFSNQIYIIVIYSAKFLSYIYNNDI